MVLNRWAFKVPQRTRPAPSCCPMTCATAAVPNRHLRCAEALKTESGACAPELRGLFSWRAEAPSTDTLGSSAPQLAVPKGARGCAVGYQQTQHLLPYQRSKAVSPGKLISSAYFGLKNSVLHRLLWSLEPVLKDSPRCTMWRHMSSQQSPAFAFHLLWLNMFVANWLCIPPGEYSVKTKILNWNQNKTDKANMFESWEF